MPYFCLNKNNENNVFPKSIVIIIFIIITDKVFKMIYSFKKNFFLLHNY